VGSSLDGAGINREHIKAYHGAVALRFKPGKYSRVAVKIVGDKGFESLKVAEALFADRARVPRTHRRASPPDPLAY
jgi:hypothetical protein